MPPPTSTPWVRHARLMPHPLPHTSQATTLLLAVSTAAPTIMARSSLQNKSGSAAIVAAAVEALPWTKDVRLVPTTGDARTARSTSLLRGNRE